MQTFLEKRVQMELTRMDSNLFLDKEVDKNGGYLFYSVKMQIPEGAPVTIVDWRELGYPLPLHMDIVAKVRSQEGSMKEAFDKAMVDNAIKKELQREETDKEIEGLIDEHGRQFRKHRHIYGLGEKETRGRSSKL